MTCDSSNVDFTKILTFLEAQKPRGIGDKEQKRLSILDEFFTNETDRCNAKLQEVTAEVARSAFISGCRDKLREARAILSILRYRERFINKAITRLGFLRRVSLVHRSYNARKGR